MHIVVGTRSVPDTNARPEVRAGQVAWGDAPLVINPWDEYAVEEALNQTSAAGGKVTVIALGPEEHTVALRHALAMGAGAAIRLWDEAWAGLDSRGYAVIFAAAVQKLGDVDLVFFGKEAADEATDQHIVQTARRLGWPLLGGVARIVSLGAGGAGGGAEGEHKAWAHLPGLGSKSRPAFEAGQIRVERLLEEGRQTAACRLPAVMSLTKEINTPRYPSFMGIRKATKADIPVWDAAALGLDLPAPKVRGGEFQAPPARETTCAIIEGDSVQAKVAALVDRLLAEKVI